MIDDQRRLQCLDLAVKTQPYQGGHDTSEELLARARAFANFVLSPKTEVESGR
jgi:hypothetical protein